MLVRCHKCGKQYFRNNSGGYPEESQHKCINKGRLNDETKET